MKRVVLFVAALLLASVVHAADTVSEATKARLKGVLAQVMQGSPDAISATPIPGIYEAAYGAQLFYLSEDGRYLINGEVFDVQKRVSLTEQRRSQARLAALKSLGDSSMIVYPAKGKVKHIITVFTDIDCGYCRKLHQGMAEMNELGITVRYLAFPRAGVGSDSFKKAVAVWCAKDRNKAMDLAKGSQPVTDSPSCDAPIERHMAVAATFGVNGTPAIVTGDGRMLPGYLPPKQLLDTLDGKQ